MKTSSESRYAVLGLTGQVGAATAEALLSLGQRVRAVVRNPAKAAAWVERGVELVQADWHDAEALGKALEGVSGAFVMIPPVFYPDATFTESRQALAALKKALVTATVPKVVALSSVGAQHDRGLGIIAQPRLVEIELADLPQPIAFIRAAWFMENSRWDFPAVRETGELPAYLQPLDRAFPMVATADVGRTAAETLLQDWQGHRVIELEGPRRYSQNDLAGLFGQVLGKPVHAVELPREQWDASFVKQGATPGSSTLRIEMLDGFNSGWIDFADQGTEHRRGTVTMESVLPTLAH